MAKELFLVGMSGSIVGKHYTFGNREGVVGSATGCDIVLSDRSIQPRHAQVHQMLERWFITPISGAVSVNGVPIASRSRLNGGDRVTIGSLLFGVEVHEAAEIEVGGGVVSNMPRLGDYFVRRGFISEIQLAAVAKRQSDLRRDGTQQLFGQVAYDLGYISRSQLDTALADQRADFNQRFLD